MIKKHLSIIWGTKKNAIIPEAVTGFSVNELDRNHPIIQLQEQVGAHSIIFNHQVHGTIGHIIHNKETIGTTLLTEEGDFLITNQPGIALGILTADCLPLIMYHPEKHLVALIHAGWKGAVQGVIQKAIDTLKKEYAIDPASLTVLCGPAAQACCYEVKDDFHTHFKDDPNKPNSFETREGKLFFSLSGYANGILDSYGIPTYQRDFSANCCTICSTDYYSYRKDKKTEYRNITLVSLK